MRENIFQTYIWCLPLSQSPDLSPRQKRTLGEREQKDNHDNLRSQNRTRDLLITANGVNLYSQT
jgi:hypothetical protein